MDGMAMSKLTEQLRASATNEKSKCREYVVTLDAEWRGCTMVINALSEYDALARVSAGELGDIDTSGAELINWHVRKAEVNG